MPTNRSAVPSEAHFRRGAFASWRREGSTKLELFLRSKPDGMVSSSESLGDKPRSFFTMPCVRGVEFLRAEPSLGQEPSYDVRRYRKFVPAVVGVGGGHPSPWQPITKLEPAAMEQSAVVCLDPRLRCLVPVSGIKRQRFRQIHRKTSARLNLAIPLSCISAALKSQSRRSRSIYSRHESKKGASSC